MGLSLGSHVALAWVIATAPGQEIGPTSSPEASNTVVVSLTSTDVRENVIRDEVKETLQLTRKPQTSVASSSSITQPISEEKSKENPPQPFIKQPEPHYFRTKELTEKPQVSIDVSPDLGLELTGVPEQTAILRLFINEQGDIDRVVIEKSYLPEEIAHVVTDAFSKMKFQPGKIDDMPVKSQMKIEVRLDRVPGMPN